MVTVMSKKEFEVEIIKELLEKHGIFDIVVGHIVEDGQLYLYSDNHYIADTNEGVYEYLLSLPPIDDRVMREVVTMAKTYEVEPPLAKEETLQVLFVPAGGEPQVRTIDNTLEAFQSLVGGYIEVLRPFKNRNVVVVANEEARLLGLKINRPWLNRDNDIVDVICGDFFVCYHADDSEGFTSLRDYQLLHYGHLLRNPLREGTVTYKVCKILAENPPASMFINL